MIDIHSHILAGFDDGASSLEESIEMCRIAKADGIETIVATPHILKGNYRNEDPQLILEKIEELKAKSPDGIEILPGSDVHFQHDIIHRLIDQRSIISINNKCYLLIEFPFNLIPVGTKEVFRQLLSNGYKPIITHPERNLEFIQSPKLLFELIQEGALAQITAMSIIGEFGSITKKASHHFLKHNLVHVIASDAHDASWRTPTLKEAVTAAAEIIGPEKAKAMVEDNPRSILKGEELPFFEEPIFPKLINYTFI
jgi:protein-tyrosine phosphatase